MRREVSHFLDLAPLRLDDFVCELTDPPITELGPDRAAWLRTSHGASPNMTAPRVVLRQKPRQRRAVNKRVSVAGWSTGVSVQLRNHLVERRGIVAKTETCGIVHRVGDGCGRAGVMRCSLCSHAHYCCSTPFAAAWWGCVHARSWAQAGGVLCGPTWARRERSWVSKAPERCCDIKLAIRRVLRDGCGDSETAGAPPKHTQRRWVRLFARLVILRAPTGAAGRAWVLRVLRCALVMRGVNHLSE